MSGGRGREGGEGRLVSMGEAEGGGVCGPGGGVEGWRGGVWQAGRDSGSLSGLTVGSNGSYLSTGSGGVIGPFEGVDKTVGCSTTLSSTGLGIMSTSSSASLARSTKALGDCIIL